MNDFLNQFLIECREIVEQAAADLLALEKSPRDAQLLDGVFRAFHTLKGSAGIVEFAAMEQAVHATENLLSGARATGEPISAELVAACLACLDRVLGWLDTIERTGELPAVTELSVPDPAAQTSGAEGHHWLREHLTRNAAAAGRARSAVRFIPDADCFFEGEDPIARILGLPQLLAFDTATVNEWPALSAFDPYRCNLILTALTAAPPEALARHMTGCAGECEILAVAARQPIESGQLGPRAREVLEAQIALLDETRPRILPGRIAAAGLTAANVMRFSAQDATAETFAEATQRSLAEKTIQPLREAIARILEGAAAGNAPTPVAAARIEAGSRTLRIDAARIDTLVRLTSELTVAKNALGHLVKVARTQANPMAGSLKNQHELLERLVAQVQASVLGLRVLPLRSVFQRFPRVLREMSSSLDKQVRLEIEGEETEADKTIVEILFEPLLHIIRNSIDHGVESPDERARRGKSPTAIIQLRAKRQSDHVLIEVSDDGGGIDLARVREVARTRAVATEEALRAMSEAELVNLIFAPGFSTASTVTELSGRGVGMDAVRAAVERIGGRVSVTTRAGLGTTVSVLLPFSVMMTRILTVEAGGQLYGIPLDAIAETVRVPVTSIAGIGASRAIVVRERTIPVIALAGELGMGQGAGHDTEATIVIADVAGLVGGIQVERVGEQMEAILQPLDGLLAGTPGITGTTLLGDGRVLLVLDIGALLQ